MISRGSAVFCLRMGFAPGRSNNAPWSAPSARVSRISLKTTRAFTCSGRKDWRWVFSSFLFAGNFGLTRNSRHLPLSSSCPFAFACSFVLPAKHAQLRTDLPFLGRLKPFPRFYILDEIPAALCQFITFANQMMSLDILRRRFIVVFYAS